MQNYRVIVSGLPEQRVELVRSLREIGNVGLQGAADLVHHIAANLPCALMDGVSREIADQYQSMLQRVGVTVEVEESATASPMLLSPQINERAQWGGLRGRKSRW